MSKRKFKVGDRVVGTGMNDLVDITGMVGTVITESATGWYDYRVKFDDSNPHFFENNHCYWVMADKIEPLKNETIVIYRKGNQVIAHNKATGKKAVAKCSPEDTFDFNIGAKLAFERLMNTKRIVKQDKYEVGDKVKVRDDLVLRKTYYMTDQNYYDSVVPGMDDFRGKIVTISSVDKRYHIEEYCYNWTDEMFEGKVVEDCEAAETTKVKEEPKKPYNGKVVCVDVKCNSVNYTLGKIYEFKDGYLTSDNGTTFPDIFHQVYTFKDWADWTSSKFIEVVE